MNKYNCIFFKVHTKRLIDVVGRIFDITDCKFGLFLGHFNVTLSTIFLSI